MLATNSTALSSAPCNASSDLMVECELEKEDDWVIVKKQKITILVPPPSPSHRESTNPEKCMTNKPRIVQRTSGDEKESLHELTKDGHKEPNDPLTFGTGISSRVQEPISNLASIPEKLKANGNGKYISIHKKDKKVMNLSRRLPIGALNVVNRRMRVVNMERELKGVGGLRRWLEAKGLHRFITVFEREDVGKYELVNLTMGKLKEMGTSAVGPRRKLVHAIDSLCHPYYFKPLQ